ncbi:ABC transporter permease [Carnobacterium gallinarum]|uniref:ABC transporter permease n=1 Tax=Carnobacterium gallinarum TaxID=2749 RepID=UPI000556743C|nr:ABC transporter permease [Carnobacterium gallinarum]
MNKFWIIVSEVYKKNVKSGAFISMVLSPVILIAVVGLIAFFVNSNQKLPEIAILSEDKAITELLKSDNNYKINAKITTEKAAEKALKSEKIAGYLVLKKDKTSLSGEFVTTPTSDKVDTGSMSQVLTTIQTNQIAKELNLSQKDLVNLTTPAMIETKTVKFDETGGEQTTTDSTAKMIKIGSAYVVSFLIYILMIFYSAIIAQEIASEKGTRIMEIILSSVSATQHFFGKLVGILLVCLTQIVSYLLIGTIAYQFGKSLDFVQEVLKGIDLFEMLKGLIGSSLIFFVLGMVLYSVIAAFLGSLISKVEEASKAVSPLTFVIMIGFFGGMYGMNVPNAPLVKIGSYVPLFTPFIMPFRMANDTVTTGGVIVSIVIMLAFTAVLTYLASMMYRSNVLVYSDTGLVKTIKNSWVIMRNERKKN